MLSYAHGWATQPRLWYYGGRSKHGNAQEEAAVEAFAVIGMSFGIMGFMLGGAALSQVEQLKKEMKGLKDRLERE